MTAADPGVYRCVGGPSFFRSVWLDGFRRCTNCCRPGGGARIDAADVVDVGPIVEDEAPAPDPFEGLGESDLGRYLAGGHRSLVAAGLPPDVFELDTLGA